MRPRSGRTHASTRLKKINVRYALLGYKRKVTHQPITAILVALNTVQKEFYWGEVEIKHLTSSIMDPVSLGAQLNSVLLKVKSHDYNEVYETAFTYGLYEMEWEELHDALNAKSTDGLITRQSFSDFFTERGSESSLSENLNKKILGIFNCFDRTGSDFCDVDELTCGLSLFIRG